jgi:hypothetical protein
MPVITAKYVNHDDARAAATALERAGLDASDIAVRTETPIGDSAWEADLESTGDVGARSLAGGVVGAAIGAVAALVVVVIIGPDPLGVSLVVAGIGGGIAGAVLGGFWAGAGELPVQSESFDTYGPDHGTATVVAHVPEDDVDRVRATLTDSGSSRISIDNDHADT